MPDIRPSSSITIPGGKLPLIIVYVNETAGKTALADNATETGTPDGNVPIEPAGVFHTGCAILMYA
jgi:hypothetical protein